MVGALNIRNALDIRTDRVNIVQRGIDLAGQLCLHVLHPAVEGAKHMQQRLVKDLLFTLPLVVPSVQAEHIEVEIVERVAQALDCVKELGARRLVRRDGWYRHETSHNNARWTNPPGMRVGVPLV